MKTKSYHIIGLMSGTSLDGLDLCYVKFRKSEFWNFEILFSETREYSEKWREALKNAITLDKTELQDLDKEYSSYLSAEIKDFIEKNGIEEIDLVCSHGHTVFHKPQRRLTYQIGNLPEIKSYIYPKIVCDFRVQDVQLGGQGAPLVPIGDRLLFKDYEFCLNLGGFANVSYENIGERLAFDICPVNIVMNHYTRKIGRGYDDSGNMARKGELNESLLNSLNDLSFYKEEPPKSLGLEWVKEEVLPLIDSYKLSIEDILRTFVEHAALQITSSTNHLKNVKILVTGGGAFNIFLMERLQALSSNQIVIPDNEIIEYKEALVFAFLGLLKIRNEVNCLSSVTGASHDHSSGKIYV